MSYLAVFGTVFALTFLAELPDKSMFASLVLGTRYRPSWVWARAGRGVRGSHGHSRYRRAAADLASAPRGRRCGRRAVPGRVGLPMGGEFAARAPGGD